jgi:hypothetical protein
VPVIIRKNEKPFKTKIGRDSGRLVDSSYLIGKVRFTRYPPAIGGKLQAAQRKPLRAAKAFHGCGLKLVVTAGTTHAARVSNWIEFLVGTKLFHAEKSHFRLPAIP